MNTIKIDRLVTLQKEYKEIYKAMNYGLAGINEDYVQLSPKEFRGRFYKKNCTYEEFTVDGMNIREWRTTYRGVSFITLEYETDDNGWWAEERNSTIDK